jgi:hypothetical protein
MTRIIIFSLAAVLLIPVLFIINHYVPFQIEAVVVYLGVGFFVVGLLSEIRPFRFIHINNRKSAFLLAVAGILVFLAGMILPSTTVRSSRPHQRIDDFMPEYQFYEYHEMSIDAPADAVCKALKEVTFTDIPVAVWLMRIRAMAAGQFAQPPSNGTKPYVNPFSKPILELLSQPGAGFLTLENNDPYEYVGGFAGKPWAKDTPLALANPDEFQAFQLAGNIKVAFNLHVIGMNNGTSRLTSETRIIGLDASARKMFSRYWRVIYPGSAIIRRVWLDAIAERAIKR